MSEPTIRDTALLRSVEERLASLETLSQHSRDERHRLAREMEKIEEKQDRIGKDVSELLKKMNHMEGKVGGALWLAGTLVTAVVLFGDKIWKFLQGLAG